MKYIILLVLVYSNISLATRYNHPETRCQVKNCLCNVAGSVGTNPDVTTRYFRNIDTSTPSGGDIQNSCQNSRLNIYFDHDSYNLERNDKTDIYNFISRNSFSAGYNVEGFTSSSGNYDYNMRLGSQRMFETINYIQRVAQKPYRYTAKSFGERYARSSDTSSDRMVRLTPIPSFVKLLDLVKTDFYLYDQSGSMSRHWNDIKKFKYHSNNVKVYLSTMQGCNSGAHISRTRTSGGTHIWWSFWNMIDKMKPGQSITIVSDFDTTPPLSRREWSLFKERLNKYNISLDDIHFIQINGASRLHEVAGFQD